MSDTSAHRPVVHDAIGPDIPLSQAIACLSLGVTSLLMAGVLPALLGALADEHRLNAAGIGLTATFEALTMGIITGVSSVWLPPKRLKLIATIALVSLAVADFATTVLSGVSVMAVRAFAGLPEGILLWITVGMIARTVTPERWAGVFFTAMVSAQFVIAILYALWVLPDFAANGGFIGLALASVVGLAAVPFLPRAFAPLARSPEDPTGAPPPRGWFALFATLIFVAGTSVVGVFLQPLAHEAGLATTVSNNALWVSLAAQIPGGLVATALAGRVRYLTIFTVSTVVYIASWLVFLVHPPGWMFISANAVAGFVGVLFAPFLVPMAIEADPSRRAAVQSGGTQVLAGALGPFAASFVVADNDVHGSILLGSVVVIMGLALIAGLHFTAKRNDHP
jgi:hypothetical protein